VGDVAGRRLIVDGMNVIGSRPDGWWRDRRGAMRDLLSRLESYAAEAGDEVTVVLDSRPFDVPATALRVEFAYPAVPNAADDVIVKLLERESDPRSIEVVTSDARLAERVGALGASVIGAGSFRRLLD
jgi:predicted RNA-binding protein with PIN domain